MTQQIDMTRMPCRNSSPPLRSFSKSFAVLYCILKHFRNDSSRVSRRTTTVSHTDGAIITTEFEMDRYREYLDVQLHIYMGIVEAQARGMASDLSEKPPTTAASARRPR
jgi:hypothetical protein